MGKPYKWPYKWVTGCNFFFHNYKWSGVVTLLKTGTWWIIPGLGSVVNWPMVIVSPQDLGLWALFQMAFLWLLKWGWH